MIQQDELQYRNELKYICSESELAIVENQIKPFCQLDPHVASGRAYEIRSVYFDDSENSCFYENEDGTDPREKFRIRIYNADSSRIMLECKRKERYKTHKEGCILTREQCERLLEGTYVNGGIEDKLLMKLLIQYHEKLLRPKVIVSYDRTPYVYPIGNVRITFDRNLSSSSETDNFFRGNIPGRPVMPKGKQILEVKYDEFLPDYLYQVMNLGSLQQTAFSKYYLCRKYTG